MDKENDISIEDMTEIPVVEYNMDKQEFEEIASYDVCAFRNMSVGNFGALMAYFLNAKMRGFVEGKIIDRALRFEHKTLQRTLIGFALGIISGIADQDMRQTDPRNEKAVIVAKKIVEMIISGEINIGQMI